MIRMELRGVDDLLKKFEAIRGDMYEALAAALIAGGFPILNTAKDLAPYKTGTLMRSLHLLDEKGADITRAQPEGETSPRRMSVEPGVVKRLAKELRTKGIATVLAGTDLDYAAVQEFLYKPYLRPALSQNTQEVKDEIARALKQLVRKVTS